MTYLAITVCGGNDDPHTHCDECGRRMELREKGEETVPVNGALVLTWAEGDDDELCTASCFSCILEHIMRVDAYQQVKDILKSRARRGAYNPDLN